MKPLVKRWVFVAVLIMIMACQAIQGPVPARKDMTGAPGYTTVAIQVKDMRAAVAGIENLLERYGAREIEQQSREGKAFFYAVVLSDYYEDLLREIKTIGNIESVITTRDIREGDVMIRLVIGSPS